MSCCPENKFSDGYNENHYRSLPNERLEFLKGQLGRNGETDYTKKIESLINQILAERGSLGIVIEEGGLIHHQV
jgi:hypothetical protein